MSRIIELIVAHKCVRKKKQYFRMNEEIINAQEQRHVSWLPNAESLTHGIKTWIKEDTMNTTMRILLDLTCWKSSCTHEKINWELSSFFLVRSRKTSNGMNIAEILEFQKCHKAKSYVVWNIIVFLFKH